MKSDIKHYLFLLSHVHWCAALLEAGVEHSNAGIKVSNVPEPECVHSLSHCAAEQFPHTLYLQHTQRVVRGLLVYWLTKPKNGPAAWLHTHSPALCWDFTNRVARSTQTIRQPVTLGSRVPLWPVFSTRRILLIQATTSCDEGLAGLSKLIKPDLRETRVVKQMLEDRRWSDIFRSPSGTHRT